MTINNLSEVLEVLLGNILSLSSTHCLPIVIDKCLLGKAELSKPLKIALTGITSAGKSTLLNALVKRQIAPTGAATLTYNVNSFRHISLSPTGREVILAHLKNGEVLQLPICSLVELVDGRLVAGKDLRGNISWVEAFLDCDALIGIDLIDTPGLGSTKNQDSENTLELFKDEMRQPDVIIYMVQKAPTTNDIEAVKEFQKSVNEGSKTKVSGLNTVLAFTHCDNLRQEDVFDDLDYTVDFHQRGMNLIEQNRRKHSDFRSCFSKSFTIAALYAQSAYALCDKDFDVLRSIENAVGSNFINGEYSSVQFIKDDAIFDSIIKGQHNRKSLIDRLDMEVIRYGVWWISNNPTASVDTFKAHLISLSGVGQMESYIFTTFKRLAVFFKALKIYSCILKEVNRTLNEYQPENKKDGLRKIAVLCRDFEIELKYAFSFLSVLMDFYQGKTYFPPDVWEEALKTIDSCINGNSVYVNVNTLESYWENKLSYFRLISDNEATESCVQIIEQIKLCLY